jgi:MFS family permease
VAAVLVVPVPVDTRPAGAPRLEGLLKLFLRKSVIVPSLLGAINQYVVFGVSLGFMPVLARQLGAGDVVLGYLAMVNLIFFLLGNLAVTSSGARVRSQTLVLGSYLLFAMGIGACALTKSLPVLFLIQGCLGVAHGVGYPVLMGLTIRAVPVQSRNGVVGLHQSVYAAGIFIGPWACGALGEALGIRPMFGLTAAMVVVLGTTGAIVLSRRPGPPAGRRAERQGRDTIP